MSVKDLCPANYHVQYPVWPTSINWGDQCRRDATGVFATGNKYECPNGCTKLKQKPYCLFNGTKKPCRFEGKVFICFLCFKLK